MLKEFRPAISIFVLLTLVTGIVYPMLVTGISQATMPGKANGSLILKDGKPVGSSLIGQSFSDPKYFWGRPSATGPMSNNASASSGSNLGPTNPALMDAVKVRVQALRDADPGNQQAVPVDLVTASASGLDPHISPAAAEYQLARVARVRNLSADVVRKLVAEHTEGRQFGVLGEPRVNVLELNLALDAVIATH
jgi:potassium-transporting ATPase KdpC subunit